MKAAASALSKEEIILAIEEHVLHHMPNYGSLLALSSRDYDSLTTEAGVKELLAKTYRWLGSKPTKIQVSDKPSATQSKHRFVIDTHDYHYPYLLAARIVMFALHNTLEKRLNTRVGADTLELASIHTGLGLIIMNALVSVDTPVQFWHHGKDTGSHHVYHLKTMTRSAYASELAVYGHRHTIRAETLLAGLHKRTHRFLPDYYTHHNVSALAAPNVVKSRQTLAHAALLKLFLVSFLTALVAGVGMYIATQQPYRPSAAITEQYNKIQSLEYQYNYCKSYLKQQQNTHDQPDVVTETAIANTSAECQSLKNQYNYEISKYNERISQ